MKQKLRKPPKKLDDTERKIRVKIKSGKNYSPNYGQNYSTNHGQNYGPD